MRNVKPLYSELAIPRELATATGTLAETQRQTKEWESFIAKKSKAFKYAFLGGYRYGEAVRGGN